MKKLLSSLLVALLMVTAFTNDLNGQKFEPVHVNLHDPKPSKTHNFSGSGQDRRDLFLQQNEYLYFLCKIWGAVKYYSQQQCNIQWDELLYETIENVLLAQTHDQFNAVVMEMLLHVGDNEEVESHPSFPNVVLNFDFDWIESDLLSSEVKSFLEVFTNRIYPSSKNCLLKQFAFDDPYRNGWIDFRNDQINMSLNYFHEVDRLMLLFYYWNHMNYFFPYKDVMDQDWDTTLIQFTEIFRQSLTELALHKSFFRLTNKINDTHGFTSSPLTDVMFWGGYFVPDIYLKRIEDKCVVIQTNGSKEIQPGDILTHIDGTCVVEIEDSLSQFISASNMPAMYQRIYTSFLRGPMHSSVTLSLLNAHNVPYDVTLVRNKFPKDYTAVGLTALNPVCDSYCITSCGSGYVNMDLLESSQIHEMMEVLKDVPAIIFDLRNYPRHTLWTLIPYIFEKPRPFAIFQEPALTQDNNSLINYLPGWYYEYNDQWNFGNWYNASPYSGDIYILVDEVTLSLAEYTAQALSYHPNATVIGTQTAGADGNISIIVYPGGIRTVFTSLGMYYADGSPQQRVGVKIDRVVAPTIAGIRAGIDEVLQSALDCVDVSSPHAPAWAENVVIYPNPVRNILNVDVEGVNETVCIEILNSRGELIYQGRMKNHFAFPTEALPAGLYFVKLKLQDKIKVKRFIKH